MRLGFDAKRIFHNTTGLGNYGRDVVRILHQHTPVEEFVLYNTKPAKENRLEQLSRTTVKYPKGFWKKLSSIWRLGPVTRQIVNDDITIFHGLSGEMPAGLKKNNIFSVVTIHDLIFLSHPRYYSLFDRIIYRRKFQHAVKNADKIIAISEQTKHDTVKYFNIPKDKIQVVYQGCNAAYKKEYNGNRKRQIVERYKLPERFVLNVGTLQERKNALTIVKAIHRSGHFLVLIGGKKNYAKRIHSYIKRYSLQRQVLFLTNVPVTDLAIIYQLATVFCYPSICEGFGIPIIESLYSRTPVITTKGGCFPEAGGPSSIYIDPNDEVELSEKLKLVFDSVDLRNRITEEGFKYAQRFNDVTVAQNLYNVYRSLVEVDTSKNTAKLSALMITFNEIEHIGAVLKNLSFADEIIVIDSFSTDGTVEIIKKHENVKLIQRPFKNFTDQKSFALKQASYDWVLFMDADERVTPSLKNEISNVINNANAVINAYYFYRKFMFEDKVLHFSGWQTDKNYRLFRKSKVHFAPEKIVHETLVVDGESGALKNKLIHYSYKNYEDYKGKMIRYGKMKAHEEAQKGKNAIWLAYMFRPLYKFFNHYILRLGIFDGKKGIIISYLNALGVHSRYKELRRIKQAIASKSK